MYLACYWRIPQEGTAEKSDRIELLDLHDINNKHGDSGGGYYFVNFEITAEKVTDAGNCGLGLVACHRNFPPSLSLLMCLQTPDRVTSPYCPFTALTVNVRNTSCGHVALISEDVHNQCSKGMHDTRGRYRGWQQLHNKSFTMVCPWKAVNVKQ